MTRTAKRTSAPTDAAILVALDAHGGHISRTARALRVRKARVVAVNRANGNHAKDKKERAALEAAEALVHLLSERMQRMTLKDLPTAHKLGIAFGAAVDRYVLLVDRANARRGFSQATEG